MVSSSGQKVRNKDLATKLRKARKAANLTQTEVAQKAGIHVNWYARVERGEENPSYEKLEAIKKALGVKTLD